MVPVANHLKQSFTNVLFYILGRFALKFKNKVYGEIM